jgi:DNA-binding NarL/FixJ family response regulator
VGLGSDDNLQVVLEADNGEDLLNGLKENATDVIIMDLKMPIMDGMEATKEVRKKFPSIKVLVVTMYEDDKFIIHLMENGANGYLLKNADSDEIRKSIYAVHENGYYFICSILIWLIKRIIILQFSL